MKQTGDACFFLAMVDFTDEDATSDEAWTFSWSWSVQTGARSPETQPGLSLPALQ